MTLISRWFEQTTASQEYEPIDYVLLWLILVAGACVRFWGLGNVGLHGDEETMAMPAMAILETGQPYLPSGMYYSRALLNILMMSGSVWVFGESEWAFRFPSAVVGSFTGLAAFFLGRRFLSPQVNIAFVATITLLPSMIAISQTARMYVFFVTSMIWFGACLFQWERNQRVSSLLLALLVWVLGLHFHTLAIFAAPLFLFPGLSRKSWTQLIQGGVAFVAGGLAFYSYDAWITAKYPQNLERPPDPGDAVTRSALDVLWSGNKWLLLASIVVVIVSALVLLIKLGKLTERRHVLPAVMVGIGLLAMSVLHYHVGGILLVFGSVFWLRTAGLPRLWLMFFLSLAVILAAMHLGILHGMGTFPGRKLIGALVGTPSVWPILRFATYSPVAGVIYGAVLMYAVVQLAKGRALPMHFLFFAMAVWLPLLIVGYFKWYVPPRYTQGQIGFFLLCAFAGTAYLGRELRWMKAGLRLPRSAVAVLALVAVALINPMVLARTVNPDYNSYPDHKGAAEFIRSLELPPDAILIAEDVLQQTYYLGQVDYSLRPIDDAVPFSVVEDEKVVDQYTGTPVLGTGTELEALFESGTARQIYIIGSGENFVRGERLLRGRGIAEVLRSERLEVVYEGRDKKTTVWKLR